MATLRSLLDRTTVRRFCVIFAPLWAKRGDRLISSRPGVCPPSGTDAVSRFATVPRNGQISSNPSKK
jgi:hypothetical protein